MGIPKSLITRGDDLGSIKASVAAFKDAYENGILKNASIMSCCEHIAEAGEVMSGHKGLCAGLHMTMNAEWDNVRWGPVSPLDKVPSLVNEKGEFFKSTTALFENKPAVEDFLTEADAQLDRAAKHGFDIRYADEHMVFSWVHKDLKQALTEWCKKKGLVYGDTDKFNTPLKKAEDFKGDPVEQMIEAVRNAETGINILLGHPLVDEYDAGILGCEGLPVEEVIWERDWDRRIFTDKRMLDFIEQEEIKTVRYDEA